uniref:Uncharacterized protein n=1 Tax=Kalanchoe fedtschenkoi TaxID=63787 RepID=A0A7N1A089_KALFE
MAHDQQEFGVLEELMYKREQGIQALTCELEGERVASPSCNASVNDGSQFDFPTYDYPPLKCNVNEVNGPDGDFEGVEKYAFWETPRSEDRLRNFDHRISDMENTPRSPSNGDMTTSKCILERNVDETSDIGDDTTDRICIIDSIYHGAPHTNFIENKAGIGVCEDSSTNPRDSMDNVEWGSRNQEALHEASGTRADRESMKQAIISMRTDKAQLVLLREIAQQLCKEMAPEKRAPVKKQLIWEVFHSRFCLMYGYVDAWITSFILWRKKARQIK